MHVRQRLVFASHNPHKIQEISDILGPQLAVTGLTELGCFEEIPEPYDTLEENAMAKARYIYDTYQVDCFADDTGLEVDALGGQPGVRSARYAGAEKNSQANVSKLLTELSGISNRRARFRTVIALVMQGRVYLFEGIVEGAISHVPTGEKGFGYDPVFIPDGYDKSFAEMDDELKNKISHRKMAISKLVDFLKIFSSAPGEGLFDENRE